MMREKSEAELRREWLKCAESPVYFVTRYLFIYNPHGAEFDGESAPDWVRFRLWPAQRAALERMQQSTRLVVLKARQLGLSWLALAYALWKLVFGAPATVLLFSLREDESAELLSRLKGMYRRLETWQRARAIVQDSRNAFELSTGSRCLSFSTRAGRSYTGSLAIVDEADYIPNLDQFLNAVKPTIDGGGQLFLISTSDKRRPVSTFKNLFRIAEQAHSQGNASRYESLFLPWSSHPARDEEWHARTKSEMHAQRGSDDDFFAEYPASIEEALAPEQLDRRIPLGWLQPCFEPSAPLPPPTGVNLPGLSIYSAPAPGHGYVIGADPAEGNPHSDDSVATVLDAQSWRQCAVLAGKIEPTVFAGYIGQLSRCFNDAPILPERNNHGHTVIAALLDDGHNVLCGYDGKRGWLSNVKGKALLYNALADAVRDGACIIHSAETASQIASIEASSLRAPAGLHDDYADSYALAVVAALNPAGRGAASHVSRAIDPLEGIDETEW